MKFIRTTSIKGVWSNHPPQRRKRLAAASKRATLNHYITSIFLPFFLSYFPQQIISTYQQPIYQTRITPMLRRHSSVVSPYHHLSKVISPYHHFTIFSSHEIPISSLHHFFVTPFHNFIILWFFSPMPLLMIRCCNL